MIVAFARRSMSSGALRKGAGVLLAQIGATGLNIVTGVIAARVLGPEGRGLYAAVTFWPQLLGALALGGLPVALVVLSRRAPGEMPAIHAAGLAFGLIAAVIATGVGMAAIPPFLGRLGPEAVHVAQLCVLTTVINLGTMLYRQMSVARGELAAFNLSSWLPSASYLALTVVLVLAGRTDYQALSYALVLSGLPVLLWLAFHHRHALADLGTGRRWMPGLANYAARTSPSEIVTVLSSYTDRLVLIALVAPAELAFYVVAYTVSRLLLIVQTAISTVLLPAMSSRDPGEAATLYGVAFRLSFWFSVATLPVAFLLDWTAFSIVYGSDFTPAVLIFRILVLEAALVALAQLTTQTFQASGRPGIASGAQVVSFALMLAGALALAPVYGASGVAAAVLGATAIRLLSLLVLLHLRLKVAPPSLLPRRTDLQALGLASQGGAA